MCRYMYICVGKYVVALSEEGSISMRAAISAARLGPRGRRRSYGGVISSPSGLLAAMAGCSTDRAIEPIVGERSVVLAHLREQCLHMTQHIVTIDGFQCSPGYQDAEQNALLKAVLFTPWRLSLYSGRNPMPTNLKQRQRCLCGVASSRRSCLQLDGGICK